MLKAYLDRGAKAGAGGVMCMAAALFWPFHYDLFLHEWQPLLDGWGADAFHATDFYGGAPPHFSWKRPDGTVIKERRERHIADSKRIPEIVARHVRQLFVVSFRQEEYEMVAPLAWRQRFGGVNRVAAQMMAQSIGHWANRVNHDGEITYFFETGQGEDEQVRDGLMGAYRKPSARHHARMASTPIGVDKGKARGLEVADLIAWHWNKYAAETAFAKSNPRPVRKDIERLLDLLHLKHEQVDIRLLTKDRLQMFLVEHGCTVTGVDEPRPF